MADPIPTREQKLIDALAVAIIWAVKAEGPSAFVQPYYEWASATKDRIPGNPTMKEVLDAAINPEEAA